mgnify:CR=1 FL=1
MRTAAQRRIAGLPSGERFDPEEVQDVTDRLTRTGAFSSVTVREAEQPNPDGTLDMIVDVVDNKLEIGLPGINGGVAVDAVKIGNGTIGGVAINGLDMAGSTVKIWGH